jgi:30S ribosomal protein 3
MENSKNLPKYLFKVLWSKTYVGIAINEIYKENCNLPLTTFYFWPREDGWKLLKSELDSKPWMGEEVKLEILNGYTSIINYWLKNINKKINIQNLHRQNFDLNVDIIATNTIN